MPSCGLTAALAALARLLLQLAAQWCVEVGWQLLRLLLVLWPAAAAAAL
jgi:hypothetical protein